MSNVENENVDHPEYRHTFPYPLTGIVADESLIPEALRGSGLSRRRLLQVLGALGGAAVVAPAPGLNTLGGNRDQAPKPSPTGTPAVRKGKLTDIKHVVILMQENRAFDHYFGTMSGVRGFGDKQALKFQDGATVFQQPAPQRADGVMMPFRMETGKYNAQNAPGTNNDWTALHNSMNFGQVNGWIPAQTERTMGYFTGADIPWHHALADAYTICDHNFDAIAASTSPNRLYMWSGMIDPSGEHGGPVFNNSGDYKYAYTWKTYPEALQEAGVSWQIYVNNDAGSGWLGDFGDNTLRSFAQFNPANRTDENSVPGQGLFARANVLNTYTTPTVPNTSEALDYVLKEWIADCAAGTIPEVSWIVSPAAFSEHASAAPDWGAVYTDRVIKALHSNQELWDSTLLIITYDENDGFYDHVQAPVPEPGTPDEFLVGAGEGGPAGEVPIGPGTRVPMILVSPWTRGGYVSSEVFDHTSLIQFLEVWTAAIGKPAVCENITDWRRTVCGDLTSAIDLNSFDNSFPDLPDTAILAAAVLGDAALPSIDKAIPGPYLQTMPEQEEGTRTARPVPYQQHGRLMVDRSTGKVTAHLTNTGVSGVSMLTLPDRYKPFTATPATVTKKTPKTYVWDTNATDGNYAFTVYGPDRFVRSFAGTVVNAGQNLGSVPRADAELVSGRRKLLRITLANDGQKNVRFILTRNDFAGTDQTVFVSIGRPVVIDWPTDANGYYDVVIAADTADGFTHRYAGRIS